MTSSTRWHAGAPALVALAAAIALATAPLPAQSATAAPHDYTPADVHFVQGMIYHHAQAVVMSEWAPSHGARPQLQTLCKRIALSQRDEITMMQNWLRDRRLPVPDPLHVLRHDHAPAPTPARESGGMAMHDSGGMAMPGMDMGEHPMVMPGMLTPEEMHQLDAAHGAAFDRLYLTGMIRHHQGALDMVAKLFATPGAGQQSDLFALATDVDAGQRAEIARMQAMLNTLTASQTQ